MTQIRVQALEAEYQKKVVQVREECIKEMRSEREQQMLKCARERVEKELRHELAESLTKEIS